MANGTKSPKSSHSRWQRFKGWAASLALLLGLLIAALLVAEIPAVQTLAKQIDSTLGAYPWLVAIPIGLMVLGGGLMLGGQFLPAPRQPPVPANEALDAAASMDYSEEHGRWSRSIEMEASTEQLREAWRWRSWRYSRRWRVFFLMLIGAVLLSVGLALLFIFIGPPWIKVLAAGLTAGVAIWILWVLAVS